MITPSTAGLVRVVSGLFLIFAGLLAAPSLAESPGKFESAMARFHQGEFGAARAALDPLAKAGDPRAQYNLGAMMYEGKGGAKDLAGALGWFRKAAAQGNAMAAHALAAMYDNGTGVAQDKVEAARWYRIAADKGDADAQYNLGLVYLAGEGVPKDAAIAVSWWRKSADQGNANAQFNLGIAYGKGGGVARDSAESLYWMRRAAAQGFQQAVAIAARLGAQASAADLAEVAKLEAARAPLPKAEAARVDAAKLAASSAPAAPPAASGSSQTALSPTEQAIASYLNTTLPAIERMKPLVGQPEAERARAFAGMGLRDTECDAAAVDAIKAREPLAEGAANICRGLIAWMQADEISTCSKVKYTKSDLARTAQANPTILNRHTSADVSGTRLRLEAAAGCAQKDITYWGAVVIRIYGELSRSVSLSGELVASAAGKAPLTAAQFDQKLFQCHLARNLDDTRKSAVVEAANTGCYVVSDLVRKKIEGACESIDEGLKGLGAAGAGDPFAREAAALRTSLIDRFSDLSCGPILTAAHVRARAEAARIQQAEAARAQAAQATQALQAAQAAHDRLQIQLRRNYEELAEWDNEYGGAPGGTTSDQARVIDGYCQIYNRINQTQFDIVNALKTISELQPSSANLGRLKEAQSEKEKMNISRNRWCDIKTE